MLKYGCASVMTSNLYYMTQAPHLSNETLLRMLNSITDILQVVLAVNGSQLSRSSPSWRSMHICYGNGTTGEKFQSSLHSGFVRIYRLQPLLNRRYDSLKFSPSCNLTLRSVKIHFHGHCLLSVTTSDPRQSAVLMGGAVDREAQLQCSKDSEDCWTRGETIPLRPLNIAGKSVMINIRSLGECFLSFRNYTHRTFRDFPTLLTTGMLQLDMTMGNLWFQL